MRKINVIGVDLAKNVIQVSVVSGSHRELSNRSLTRKKLAEFLAKQKPSLVAFEACGTAHYWARYALRHGHEATIIPAKAVTPYRHHRPSTLQGVVADRSIPPGSANGCRRAGSGAGAGGCDDATTPAAPAPVPRRGGGGE